MQRSAKSSYGEYLQSVYKSYNACVITSGRT